MVFVKGFRAREQAAEYRRERRLTTPEIRAQRAGNLPEPSQPIETIEPLVVVSQADADKIAAAKLASVSKEQQAVIDAHKAEIEAAEKAAAEQEAAEKAAAAKAEAEAKEAAELAAAEEAKAAKEAAAKEAADKAAAKKAAKAK